MKNEDFKCRVALLRSFLSAKSVAIALGPPADELHKGELQTILYCSCHPFVMSTFASLEGPYCPHLIRKAFIED